MSNSIRWGMGASAILLALSLAAPTSAQQPVTPAPKVIPAQKPATPPGPPKDAKAPKTPKKAKSACNTQYKDEKSCVADPACAWVPAQVDAKTGKQKRRAYCRVKPTPPAPKKKGATPAPKQTPAPKTTAPAPAPAPKAPAPKAPPAPAK